MPRQKRVTVPLSWPARTKDNRPLARQIEIITEPIIDAALIAALAPYVQGPASAGDARIAVFDGTTGKLIKDGGATIAGVLSTALSAAVAAIIPIDLTSEVSGDLPFANLTQGNALSVLGVAGNAGADVASIAAGSDKQVLRRAGTALAFGAIDLSSSAAVTGDLPYANITPATAVSLLFGRGSASGAGDWQEITLGANLTMTGTVLAAAGGSGSPGGSDTHIQLNDGGAFFGEAALTWAKTTDTLSVDGAAVFNDSGADKDFRVEGDTEANLFFLDASTDRIGIGTASPGSRLHLVSASDGLGTAITLGTYGTANGYLNAPASLYINVDSGNAGTGEAVFIGTNRAGNSGGTVLMKIQDNGRVGINQASPDGTLHVFTASAGTITANAVADDLTVENSDDVGLQFLCPNNKVAYILFGDPDATTSGQIAYDHATDTLDFTSGGVHTQFWKGGNSGIGTSTFGSSAVRVLGIANGTEPTTSPADMVQVYSVDLSAGNATLGLRTETAVVSEIIIPDSTLMIKINGAKYKIPLSLVP